MYKQDLALNYPQGLICYKTQPNETSLPSELTIPSHKLKNPHYLRGFRVHKLTRNESVKLFNLVKKNGIISN